MDSVCLSHSLQSIWLQCHNCVRTTLHAITKEAYSKWSERTILRDYYNCETQVRTLRRQIQNSARIFCWHRRMNSIDFVEQQMKTDVMLGDCNEWMERPSPSPMPMWSWFSFAARPQIGHELNILKIVEKSESDRISASDSVGNHIVAHHTP